MAISNAGGDRGWMERILTGAQRHFISNPGRFEYNRGGCIDSRLYLKLTLPEQETQHVVILSNQTINPPNRPERSDLWDVVNRLLAETV